jgi:hypothetical protein
MTRLMRNPSGEGHEKGRQLCRFVGREPAADATFRRIGARRPKCREGEDAARPGAALKSAGIGRNSISVSEKPIDIGFAGGVAGATKSVW